MSQTSKRIAVVELNHIDGRMLGRICFDIPVDDREDREWLKEQVCEWIESSLRFILLPGHRTNIKDTVGNLCIRMSQDLTQYGPGFVGERFVKIMVVPYLEIT